MYSHDICFAAENQCQPDFSPPQIIKPPPNQQPIVLIPEPENMYTQHSDGFLNEDTDSSDLSLTEDEDLDSESSDSEELEDNTLGPQDGDMYTDAVSLVAEEKSKTNDSVDKHKSNNTQPIRPDVDGFDDIEDSRYRVFEIQDSGMYTTIEENKLIADEEGTETRDCYHDMISSDYRTSAAEALRVQKENIRRQTLLEFQIHSPVEEKPKEEEHNTTDHTATHDEEQSKKGQLNLPALYKAEKEEMQRKKKKKKKKNSRKPIIGLSRIQANKNSSVGHDKQEVIPAFHAANPQVLKCN